MTRILLLVGAIALGPLPPRSSTAGERDASKGKYNVWVKERVRYLHNRVQRTPRDLQLRLLLANAYYRDGQAYEAKEQLRAALEVDPDYPEAHCNLAVILHAQSQLPEAQQHYERALQLEPSLVEAQAGMGTLLCRTSPGRGIQLLEAVLSSHAGRHKVRYNLGVAYHRSGDFRMALAHLEELRRRDPSYPELDRALAQAYVGRGLGHLQAGQAREAAGFFKHALKCEQNDPDLHFAAGLAHLRLGEMAEAEAAFAAAVELNEDHVPALHNLATVYERTGRLPLAKECYERVRMLTPHLNTIEAARNAQYNEEYLFR